MKTVFLRALEADVGEKAAVLKAAIHTPGEAEGRTRFEVAPASFAAMPRSPFAYWIVQRVRSLFREFPRFDANADYVATRGASTCDDFRYVRLWFEPSVRRKDSEEARWIPFTKGGRFARFYSAISQVVDWHINKSTFRGFVGRPGRWLEKPEAVEHYFRAGITWPLRGVIFSAQAVPHGCIFGSSPESVGG